MAYIGLKNIITDGEIPESYTLFRTIEDWCLDNIPNTAWRFDHSCTICIYGVDLPAGIIFNFRKDLIAFKQQFGC
jgi:hypothetical protein